MVYRHGFNGKYIGLICNLLIVAQIYFGKAI